MDLGEFVLKEIAQKVAIFCIFNTAHKYADLAFKTAISGTKQTLKNAIF